jgi:dihydrofolate reductase
MTTGHVFIATSLDGFIAREDGRLDWLEAATADAGGEDHGYTAFMAGIDGLIMGRATFETVLAFDAWPYDRPVIVLSRSGRAVEVPGRPEAVAAVAGSPAAAFAEADRLGWRRAYVDGGQAIRACLAEGRIADLVLTRVPVLLGAGRPLFGALPADLRLVHAGTQAFPSGLVQSRYRVSG